MAYILVLFQGLGYHKQNQLNFLGKGSSFWRKQALRQSCVHHFSFKYWTGYRMLTMNVKALHEPQKIYRVVVLTKYKEKTQIKNSSLLFLFL